MTFSYTNTLAATKDQVRWLIGDTVDSGHLVEDEEITWALTQQANVYFAAALVASRLGAASGNVAKRKVDDVEIEYRPASYRELAADLRRQGLARGVLPYAGGISVSDKDAVEDDTDRVAPAFTRELFRQPGVESTEVEVS